MKYDAVLFDLDGTLIDSAPDLLITLNTVLQAHGRPVCADDSFGRYVSQGSKKLLELGFDGDYPIPLPELRQQFLDKYQQQNTQNTDFYAGILPLLTAIEDSNTPWGIITNKPTRPTVPIAEQLQLDRRAAAIVCGDTLPVAKPDPAPIALACKMIGVIPERCVYIGDSRGDVTAGQLAGMATIACAYGYIEPDDDVNTWQADAIVQSPDEIWQHLISTDESVN